MSAAIANVLNGILLQAKSQGVALPKNVTAFKKSALVNQLVFNKVNPNDLYAKTYDAVLKSINEGTLLQLPPEEESEMQNEESSFLPQSQSMISSSNQNSQSLGLKPLGGNSLETFWSNYRDYDEGVKPEDEIKAGISTGNINGIKLAALKTMGSQILAQKPKDLTPKWVTSERGSQASSNWAAIPGAKFDNGKWRSKFFRAPATAEQLSKAVEKKKALLKTMQGVSAATSNFTYPLVEMLNKVLTGNGYQPMGAISAKGIPLYLGRYYDPVTKKIKTISKPKITINPYDWNQVYNKTVLQLAANWNQFVRGTERLTSHIRNKNDWEGIVIKKKAANIPSNRRYSQMTEAMRKIYQGIFAPYEAADTNGKAAMKLAISNWKYEELAKAIIEVAEAKLKKTDLTPGEQLKWLSYKNWREHPVLATGVNLYKGSLTFPTSQTQKDLTAIVRGQDQFTNYVNDNEMKSYLFKTSRRGIKKIPKLSVSQILRLAQEAKGLRPGALLDVSLAKKIKADAPLPEFSKTELKSMYNEVTGSEADNSNVNMQDPLQGMFQQESSQSLGNAGSNFMQNANQSIMAE